MDSENEAEMDAHVKAVGLLYEVLDCCNEHGLEFDEVLDSARQSYRP